MSKVSDQDIIDKFNIYQFYTRKPILSIYILWGRNNYEKEKVKQFNIDNGINFSKLNDINTLHETVEKLSDDQYLKDVDFTTCYDNTVKNEVLRENVIIKWVLSLLNTDERPIKFPNTNYKSNFDICTFLMEKKLEDPCITDEDKQKIRDNPLILKFYKRNDIKKIKSEISKIDVFEDEIDIFSEIFDAIKGGGLFFEKPDENDEKCYDFWNDIESKILSLDNLSREDAYKFLRNQLNLQELKKILECKKKDIKDYDPGDNDDNDYYNSKLVTVPEFVPEVKQVDLSPETLAVLLKYKCDNEIKKETSKCNFKNLIRNDKLIQKINLYIQLFDLINDQENIDKLILLLEKYNQQKKEILSSICGEFKVNGELNELGKCIYNFYAIGKKQDPEQKSITNPKPRDWLEPGSRTEDQKGIKNPGNTCYMNALLQAINATDYLYRDILYGIHESGILLPITRTFDDALRNLRKSKDVLDLKDTFCTAVWNYKSINDRGEYHNPFIMFEQNDSGELLSVILNKIAIQLKSKGIETRLSNSPIFYLPDIKKEKITLENNSLQEYIDKTIKAKIDWKNSIRENLLKDLEKWRDAKESSNTKKYQSTNEVSVNYVCDEVLEIVKKYESNLTELREELLRMSEINDRKINSFNYSTGKQPVEAMEKKISITNALKAISNGNIDKLNNQVYLSEDYLSPSIMALDGKALDDEIEEKKKPIEEKNLSLEEKLLKYEDQPYIILVNEYKQLTTDNCQVEIHKKMFELKSVAVKVGPVDGGHWYTITKYGYFSDTSFDYGNSHFKSFCEKGIENARFLYFFEKKQDGGNKNNKYYSKYLKYKNKYLELSK